MKMSANSLESAAVTIIVGGTQGVLTVATAQFRRERLRSRKRTGDYAYSGVTCIVNKVCEAPRASFWLLPPSQQLAPFYKSSSPQSTHCNNFPMAKRCS
jgi:hypothetical protein